MKIRKIENRDIKTVVNLWYDVSITAHDFISKDYWEKNKELMASQYIPNSETYIAIEEDKIIGFISMIEDYLAAIFVHSDSQRKGVGKNLIDYVKNLRKYIELKVYKKNLNSINFYKKQGFSIESESLENETGEIEIKMKWEV